MCLNMVQSGVEFTQDYSTENIENVLQEQRAIQLSMRRTMRDVATSAFLISLSKSSTQCFFHNDAALLMMGEGSAAWMCPLRGDNVTTDGFSLRKGLINMSLSCDLMCRGKTNFLNVASSGTSGSSAVCAGLCMWRSHIGFSQGQGANSMCSSASAQWRNSTGEPISMVQL